MQIHLLKFILVKYNWTILVGTEKTKKQKQDKNKYLKKNHEISNSFGVTARKNGNIFHWEYLNLGLFHASSNWGNYSNNNSATLITNSIIWHSVFSAKVKITFCIKQLLFNVRKELKCEMFACYQVFVT